MTQDAPSVFMLHALGGSGAAFAEVAKALGDDFDSLALDLPGFGGADIAAGTSVQAMSDAVIAAVRAKAPSRWLLVGHSMGGKIASVVAARALKGEAGLSGLLGVVLLAASPPSPEPMDESRRDEMIRWARNGPIDDAAARSFIDENVGAPLSSTDQAVALADLERADPRAWHAWLEHGSREDWSDAVGVLPLPARVLVGSEDGDLGEAGQRATNMKVYPRAKLQSLEGAGHLLPLERSREVAAVIARFWQEVAGTHSR